MGVTTESEQSPVCTLVAISEEAGADSRPISVLVLVTVLLSFSAQELTDVVVVSLGQQLLSVLLSFGTILSASELPVVISSGTGSGEGSSLSV